MPIERETVRSTDELLAAAVDALESIAASLKPIAEAAREQPFRDYQLIYTMQYNGAMVRATAENLRRQARYSAEMEKPRHECDAD